jgi:hypothetical protein
MVKSIPVDLPESQSMKVVDISQLQVGENPNVVVSAKIVNNLDKSSDVPMSSLLVDFKHNFCVASIYHTNKSIQPKLKSGSHILIKNPHLVLVTLNFKGYQYSYQCLKVTSIGNILIDGASLSDSQATSEVISKTFV